MVAQKMGSQRVGSSSIQAQNHDPKSNPLARQGSLYSLTFAEMENQLGDFRKPLSSMNLDELLKTLFQSEAYTVKQAEGVDSGPPTTQQLSQPASLSRDLSKKTVDEVWHDIQQNQKTGQLDMKMTLGEITLEDFLVKAGVVTGNKSQGSSIGAVDPIGLSQQALWMNYPIQQPHHNNSMMPVFVTGPKPIIPIGENPEITMSSSSLMGTLSDTTQMSGRKRVDPSDIVEKSVERRQKRMIKNRESAARSRARKQAYTQELECKVSRLEEENVRLKRQQEWEKVLPSIPPPAPKYQLRRTSSAPL